MTTLKKVAGLAFGIFLILAVSSSPRPSPQKAQQFNVAADATDVKTVEKPTARVANTEPRDLGDAKPAEVAAETVKVHLAVEGKNQVLDGKNQILLSHEDLQKAQIVQISSTSTKVDTPDQSNAAVVTGQANQAAPVKVETVDTVDSAQVDPKAVLARKADTLSAPLPVEKADIATAQQPQEVPKKQQASSYLTYLLIPTLAMAALVFAAKYQSGSLPEFIEEKFGSTGMPSNHGNTFASSSSRSMYGSV